MTSLNYGAKYFRREFGISGEESYQDFRDWYYKNHNSRMYNDLNDFKTFIENGNREDVSRVTEHVREWNNFKSKKIGEMETVEEYLSQEVIRHLSCLNEYGYIYDIKILPIGDASDFTDNDGNPIYVPANTFEIDITNCLEDDSISDVKKSLSRNILFKSLNNFIEQEIKKANFGKILNSFKKSVKIVYDDMLIRENRGVYSINIKIGITIL